MVSRSWEIMQAEQKSETRITQQSSRLCQQSPRSRSPPNESNRLNPPPEPATPSWQLEPPEAVLYRKDTTCSLRDSLTLQSVFGYVRSPFMGTLLGRRQTYPVMKSTTEKQSICDWSRSTLFTLSLPPFLHLMDISWLVKNLHQCKQREDRMQYQVLFVCFCFFIFLNSLNENLVD